MQAVKVNKIYFVVFGCVDSHAIRQALTHVVIALMTSPIIRMEYISKSMRQCDSDKTVMRLFDNCHELSLSRTEYQTEPNKVRTLNENRL